MSKTLRTGLMWRFVVVATVPILALGFLVQDYLSRTRRESLEAKNELLCRVVARLLDQAMRGAEEQLDQLATFLEESEMADEAVAAALDSAVASYPLFETVSLVGPDGRVRQIGLREDRRRHRDQYLGLDLSRYPLLRDETPADGPVWSDAMIAVTGGRRVESVLVPSGPNRLVATLNLQKLQDLLRGETLAGEGVAVTILDRKGVVLVHTDKSLVDRQESFGGLAPVREGLAGREGTYAFRWEGERYRGSVRSVERVGWLAMVSQTEDSLAAPVRSIRNLVVIGTLIVLAFSALIALALAGRIARPLSRLGRAARDIARGGDAGTLAAAPYDEINLLGDTLRSMGKDIREGERAITMMVRTMVGLGGADTFEAIVRETCETLGADGAFVGRLTDDGRVETVTMRLDGELVDEHVYDLAGTPTQHILTDGYCYYPGGVREKFPDDPDLETFEVESYLGVPLQGADGRALGILGAFARRPLTMPRSAGTVLTIIATRAAAELEGERIRRERAGLEARLRQAQKMEAIGQLAGGIAHDFNNLLTGIIGYSEMILRTLPVDAPERPQVGEILESGRRAASLTRQMLAFSRKQVISPRVLDLRDVIVRAETMIRRLIGEHIELVVMLPADPRVVEVDPAQVDQILLNLAGNARDAMPDGGTLTIEVRDPTAHERNGDGNRPEVVLAVRDEGHGIEEHLLERIFEPFFTTKETGKGTGLGLATVYGIVEQSGGRIEVSSRPGMGASFRIHLPVVEAPNPVPPPAAGGRPPTGRETILLVEDEKMVRDLTRALLERLGYSVIEAENGPEAIERHAENADAIDLLLTDVVMPEMNGRVVYDRIRAEVPDLRVLYMSGYPDDIVSDQGVAARGVSYLQKPFTLDGLARKLREALD